MPARKKNRGASRVRKFFAGLLLGIILFITAIGWMAFRPLAKSSADAADLIAFSIPPGASLRRAARVIENSPLALPAWQLELVGRMSGRASTIKAGNYEVPGNTTLWDILNRLTRGDVSQMQIALIEGWTFNDFSAELNAHPDLQHDTTHLSSAELLSQLKEAVNQGSGNQGKSSQGTQPASAVLPDLLIEADSPEGLFYPDTYLFDKGSSDLHLLKRAYRAMQQHLATVWAHRNPDLPVKNPYELLILASLIEKETGKARVRGMIASVFTNRLRAGWPLQTDPAVIYGLGEKFDGNLRRQHLQTDTRWNTYTRRGLPPTPIAMPGLASMQAAANPPASDKFYFVARGDGTSVFSRTLEEHNRAVAKYQKVQQ
jgi:UPF0755 protein